MTITFGNVVFLKRENNAETYKVSKLIFMSYQNNVCIFLFIFFPVFLKDRKNINVVLINKCI